MELLITTIWVEVLTMSLRTGGAICWTEVINGGAAKTGIAQATSRNSARVFLSSPFKFIFLFSLFVDIAALLL
jgi:hypothetical protein